MVHDPAAPERLDGLVSRAGRFVPPFLRPVPCTCVRSRLIPPSASAFPPASAGMIRHSRAASRSPFGAASGRNKNAHGPPLTPHPPSPPRCHRRRRWRRQSQKKRMLPIRRLRERPAVQRLLPARRLMAMPATARTPSPLASQVVRQSVASSHHPGSAGRGGLSRGDCRNH